MKLKKKLVGIYIFIKYLIFFHKNLFYFIFLLLGSVVIKIREDQISFSKNQFTL